MSVGDAQADRTDTQAPEHDHQKVTAKIRNGLLSVATQ
jgi:hypothetical protein